MNDNDVINYSNIFLYRKKDVDTVHEAKVKAHHLVYICSGELELFENGRKTWCARENASSSGGTTGFR